MHKARSFFAKVARLNVAQLLDLAMRHREQDVETLRLARADAWKVAERLGRDQYIDDVVGQLAQWSTELTPPSGVFAVSGPSSDLMISDARRAALEALVDAWLAVTLGPALGRPSRAALEWGWDAGSARSNGGSPASKRR